jgi:hypothetical protein
MWYSSLLPAALAVGTVTALVISRPVGVNTIAPTMKPATAPTRKLVMSILVTV